MKFNKIQRETIFHNFEVKQIFEKPIVLLCTGTFKQNFIKNNELLGEIVYNIAKISLPAVTYPGLCDEVMTGYISTPH